MSHGFYGYDGQKYTSDDGSIDVKEHLRIFVQGLVGVVLCLVLLGLFSGMFIGIVALVQTFPMTVGISTVTIIVVLLIYVLGLLLDMEPEEGWDAMESEEGLDD